jgi:hypothetical protein
MPDLIVALIPQSSDVAFSSDCFIKELVIVNTVGAIRAKAKSDAERKSRT